MSSQSPFLYPNVTSIPTRAPGDSEISPSRAPGEKPVPGEFDKVFENTLGQTPSTFNPYSNGVAPLKEPVKFSAHAVERMKDRKIPMDPATMAKVSDAVDKAAAKGIEDSLILTKDAAYIVSVKNRTIVTAMDRNAVNGNVFTNIDGAIIV